MSEVYESLRKLSQRKYDETGFPRIIRASGLLFGVFLFGTFGYYFSTPEKYSFLDCAYMTVITLTTVGFGETIPITGDPGLEIFTIVLIVMGMGIMLYFVSSLTAFIIEGELRDLIRMRKMRREIEELENHFIIAGIGQTGTYVLREMLQSKQPLLVIEQNREHIQAQLEEAPRDFPFIVGDATHDAVLKQAGIERATGLVASLGNDRDNLFVTISARSLNAEVRIVARGQHPEAEQKFKMAGATSVIYTNVLGGLRMAAEVIRPEVTTFLDLMMQDHEHYRRVEELPVPDDSPLIGKTIRETKIRQHTDALVIAVYQRESDDYSFNPRPDYTLTTGSKLIVLTLIDDIPVIEKIISGEIENW